MTDQDKEQNELNEEEVSTQAVDDEDSVSIDGDHSEADVNADKNGDTEITLFSEENKTDDTEIPEDSKPNSDVQVILEKMEELKDLFENKIAADSHLKEINDKLYGNLKKYQDGMLDTIVESVYSEIILIIKDLESQVSHIPKECTEENYNKLFKRFSAIPLRLMDLLYEHDVEPYQVQGDLFEAKRQDISSTVVTNDESLKNHVKESISKGYLRHMISENGDSVDKVLRKEKVIVYKYEEGKNNE